MISKYLICCLAQTGLMIAVHSDYGRFITLFEVFDKLAECIWNRANKTFKSPLAVRSYSNAKMGHDYEENFYILLHSYCPAVLIENFFMDNHEDYDYLRTNKAMATCAEVAVAGIKDYLKTR